MAHRPPPSARWCPVCQRDVLEFLGGPRGRAGATCPHCGALERHRFLAVLLDGMAPWLSQAQLVVDVAPSRALSRVLRRLCPQALLRLDFDPAADGRSVDVRASLTALPLPSRSVDLLLCYHVLEHVPDDRTAMREVARVLRPGGAAFLQVPWRPDAETDEDVTAAPEERVRRFGQADHVRYYGRDFEQRLVDAGLDVTRFTPGGTFGRVGCELMRLRRTQAVWLVRPAAQGSPGRVDEEGLADGVTARLARLLAESRARERRTVPALGAVRGRAAELEHDLRARTAQVQALEGALAERRRQVRALRVQVGARPAPVRRAVRWARRQRLVRGLARAARAVRGGRGAGPARRPGPPA